MAARTGKQYVDSLGRMKPVIFLEGRRVASVLDEPVFQGAIQSVAELYDLQHDARYRDFMLFKSPTTGDPVHVSFQVPHSKQELVNKRKAFKLRTDHNFGFMGRTMDFMNGLVTGWYTGREKFARRGERFGENAARYYEYVRENDLYLTHVLINPQIDRSRTSAEQEEPFLHLGKVGETKQGIIVRGAKMLGTMAPITEELVCYPWGGGVAEGDDVYAVGFAIPNDTPGLKYICREPVAPPPHTRFDHPLSSRFEEMDCIAIFDDVLVPWDRVVIDGGPGSPRSCQRPHDQRRLDSQPDRGPHAQPDGVLLRPRPEGRGRGRRSPASCTSRRSWARCSATSRSRVPCSTAPKRWRSKGPTASGRARHWGRGPSICRRCGSTVVS